MMHKAWSSMVEVPYCFSRSYVKFQGHTALKIVEFDPNWAFPDCYSGLNSHIVFQGHLSNFKVAQYKTSPILTQIGRFRTIGQSQLSNPSHLPCFFFFFAISLNKLWNKQSSGRGFAPWRPYDDTVIYTKLAMNDTALSASRIVHSDGHYWYSNPP